MEDGRLEKDEGWVCVRVLGGGGNEGDAERKRSVSRWKR